MHDQTPSLWWYLRLDIPNPINSAELFVVSLGTIFLLSPLIQHPLILIPYSSVPHHFSFEDELEYKPDNSGVESQTNIKTILYNFHFNLILISISDGKKVCINLSYNISDMHMYMHIQT